MGFQMKLYCNMYFVMYHSLLATHIDHGLTSSMKKDIVTYRKISFDLYDFTLYNFLFWGGDATTT